MTLRHRVDPLVRNGLVGYGTPAAEMWPESGLHGKTPATLRQVLTHTVGVPAMPGGLGPTDLARPAAGLRGDRRDGTAVAAPHPGPAATSSPSASWSARSRAGSPAGRCGGCRTDRVAAPLGIVGELYFG